MNPLFKFYHRNDNSVALETLYHASDSELNEQDSEGQTPLLLAVKEGHYNIVKVLLSWGADIAIRFILIDMHSMMTYTSLLHET